MHSRVADVLTRGKMKTECCRPAAPTRKVPFVSGELDDVTAPALRRMIEHAVSGAFRVSICALQMRSRGRAPVAMARQVAMYLAHVSFGLSLSDVGIMFDRDRTTVAHACRLIEDCRDDPDMDFKLDLLEVTLRDYFAR